MNSVFLNLIYELTFKNIPNFIKIKGSIILNRRNIHILRIRINNYRFDVSNGYTR